jgi:hypothetical protein
MERAARLNLRVVGLVCGLSGLLGWAFYVATFSREPSQDWMVYYTAARAYFDGNLPLIFDGNRFTAALNERFADWLSWPLPLHPWLYPPHFLLLLLPFGMLPFAAAEAVFLLVTFACLIAASWCFANSAERRWLHGLSLLLCPATAITVCLGQNAFLTSALLLGGLGLLPRRPLLAGALFGMLTYKPQLWLMVPIVLIAARQWRALAAAAATALLLTLASLALFGAEAWRAWLALMLGPSELYQDWLVQGRLNGQSVYACAALLGASPALANAIQAAAAIFAGLAVYWSYRRAMPEELRVAIVLAATVLAAPHVIGYDAIMLASAATLLLSRAIDSGFRFGDSILIILVWLSPLANPPSVFRLGLMTPLVIALFIASVIARARGQGAAAAPSLSPA